MSRAVPVNRKLQGLMLDGGLQPTTSRLRPRASQTFNAAIPAHALVTQAEPRRIREALAGPDWEHWLASADSEIDSLMVFSVK